MSFILDALKKAEHARPPASMPQMPAVSVAATTLRSRRQLPGWLIAGGGALAMLVMVAVVWQFMSAPVAPSAAPPPSTAQDVARTAATGNAYAGDKTLAPADSAQPRRADVRPLDSEARAGLPAPSSAPTGARTPSASPTSASGGSSPRPGKVTPGTVVYEGPSTVPASEGGTVRYQRNFANETPAPAQVPEPEPQSAQPAAAVDSGLPSYHSLKLRSGGMPALHLDIHVYSQVVENRFVFVNSRKYRQGQTTREGVLIEEISPTGAIMRFRGERFEMARN